jgi:hypothetical protein
MTKTKAKPCSEFKVMIAIESYQKPGDHMKSGVKPRCTHTLAMIEPIETIATIPNALEQASVIVTGALLMSMAEHDCLPKNVRKRHRATVKMDKSGTWRKR